MTIPTDGITFVLGDAQSVLQDLPVNSIDAVVTDPPYGIDWADSEWDSDVPPPSLWKEVLRVLKPGGHAVVFSGSRTYHRAACAIEDAGFEIRDQLIWCYGTGFPKAADVGPKVAEIDPEKGAVYAGHKPNLKPAIEPIVLARKPFKGTLVKNIAEWGVGALNIPDARNEAGGYPTNLAVDEEAMALLDEQSKGAASRVFYCAKPSTKEKEAGLDEIEPVLVGRSRGALLRAKRGEDYGAAQSIGLNRVRERRNDHPTVKPIELTRWLVRLVSIPGSLVLDPFVGSGTTSIACALEGRRSIGIDLFKRYLDIAKARVKHWTKDEV